ncbi:MAG: DUF3320 domain-containing protein [Kiritimatiellae bacterium]|nr:DUF3320 domain-containing protein [Kiritimatiellia bacterium]
MDDQTLTDPTPVKIDTTVVDAVDLALQQNAFPVVHEIAITNPGVSAYRDLKVEITSEPGFLKEKTVNIAELAAGGSIVLHDLNVELDHKWLAELSDSVKGEIKFALTDRDGRQLSATTAAVTACAADQWLGTSRFPELLAAFVTPNLTAVALLMKAAADDLERRTKSSAVSGYQQGKKRAYEICASIYNAIAGAGIAYCEPPTSFESVGQRVRLPGAVMKFKLGTCLDLTLLFAAVMEQCGLHPVVMLERGHAYIGCHLTDTYFPETVVDDLQQIRKLAASDNFCVIEATLATGHTAFKEAEAQARRVNLNHDEDFECAIDIYRARMSKIRPLPLKTDAEGIELEMPADSAPAAASSDGEPLRELEESPTATAPAKPKEAPSARVARWQQKLLDLSLRNRLLNVRNSAQVLPLACPDVSMLEDRLADKATFTLVSLETILNDTDRLARSQHPKDPYPEHIQNLIVQGFEKQRHIYTEVPDKENAKRLKAIFRQNKADFEDGGINTLFLGVGMLEWKMSDHEAKSYLAPILLIPVRLQRKSMADGITLARLDEDTTINVTLLELLRREKHLAIPELEGDLPLDDHGVDVKQVLAIFRERIRNISGWEVREEAWLGLFSFNKFIMWNDLSNRIDDLKEQPLVNHLIEGGGLFDDGIEVFPPEEIAKHVDLASLYCPMSADGSQLTAVKYAELGKSFVLHGPPGTGKSQTITNIIAHELATGKRVLFVSEKRAALDVVHRRLEKIGLRPFCLELHSNKSGKTEVLAQFAEALAVADTAEPKSWDETVKELQAVRDELNCYVNALHAPCPNGITPYECFSSQMASEDEPARDWIAFKCSGQSRDEYLSMRQFCEELSTAFSSTSASAREAFGDFLPAEWTPLFERELSACLTDSKECCSALRESCQSVTDAFALTATDLSYDAAKCLSELARATSGGQSFPAEWLTPSGAKECPIVASVAKTAIRCQELERQLASYKLDFSDELDYPGIRNRIQTNRAKFFISRFFANRSLLKEMSGLKRPGGAKLTLEELTGQLDALEEHQTKRRKLAAAEKSLSVAVAGFASGGTTDWNAVDAAAKPALQVFNALAGIFNPDGAEYRCALESLRTEAQSQRLFHAVDGETLRRLEQRLKNFGDKLDELKKYANGFDAASGLAATEDRLNRCINNLPDLRVMLVYLQQRKSAVDLQLVKLAVALEDGTVAPGQLTDAFDRAYRKKMLEEILESQPVLCRFVGSTQNERIKKFCELDERYISVSRQIVYAKLASRLPRRRSGPCPEGTELGILKRECEKRARQKPVRQLLGQIPTLLRSLKPCFLMSPLSVAQYLPPNHEPFDVVVFDEASQIPVWDAIGVIARAKQLVVVGDPKQMPPTNFFQKGLEEDDSDEAAEAPEEDMESILDECLAAGVHSSYLSWHYRSRHESLIAFSNCHYYGNGLFTFPAARNGEHLGVSFRFVEGGIYDRRKSRSNRKEAEAVVDYIFDRLADPKMRKKSMGVVTFSMAQRGLIEDLVEERRASQPEFEDYFTEQCEEPFFVKNLENVQGDERDAILFSVGYAPDADGKFAMNFGPLNRDGGERRLNVAVTRAKEEVVLFSSIHGNQINLDRTKAVGAAHLKYFIEYAESGAKSEQMQAGTKAESKLETGLQEVIRKFLVDKGYTVMTNIGHSGYRINLAVVHPEHPDEYLLGIECDGPAYAKQRTTRDRDHLRFSVLRGLGWHTYRAWSVDWAFDRVRAENQLLEAIQKALTEADEPSAKKAEPKLEPLPQLAPTIRKHPFYKAWTTSARLSSENFYEPRQQTTIRKQLLAIITQEGPVFESVAQNRLIRAWGFNRGGSQIMSIVNQCMPSECPVTQFNGGEKIYWAPNQNPSEYREYRIPDREENRRAIDEIPPPELLNVMRELTEDYQSLEPDTLYRETAKCMGFSVLNVRTREFLDTVYRNGGL